MKKILIAVLALLMSLSAYAVIASADDLQPSMRDNWVGCFDNYGVEETADGLKIVYDGYYSAGLSDAYIALDVGSFTLADQGDGSEQMCFAFIDKQANGTWDQPNNGVYLYVRNIGGKLFVCLNVKDNTESKQVYFQTTDIDFDAVESIVLQKEESGYSFFIDGTEIAGEEMAAVGHGTPCDSNGKTYFAFASYSATDSTRGFVLKNVVNEKPLLPEPKPEPESKYAPYFSTTNWAGYWGLLGVTEKWNGLEVVYDGWYVNALSSDYVEINFSFVNFLESVPTTGGYSQEAIFDFAFLSEPNKAANWNHATCPNGLYLQMRNIDGKLYVRYSYRAVTDGEEILVFEETLENVSVTESMKLLLKKSESGFVVSINGNELGAETTKALSDTFFCDANGYTYFGMGSYSAGGNDADKRLLCLNYIATQEGQTPDPSILPPNEIETGEEDYDAPVGMGLTAKKYGTNGTVTQLENGVRIQGDSVLYTPLTDQSVLAEMNIAALSEGSVLRVSLDGSQKIYSLSETPAAYVLIKRENGIKCSVNGTDWFDFNLSQDVIKIAFIISDNGISIAVNEGESIETQFVRSAITGGYGTFLAFAMTDSVSVIVTSVKNCVLNADINDSDGWNNPFFGIAWEENPLVYAHATYKTALDSDFVKVNFKINGLTDTAQCTGYITFALLTENAIADPVNPSAPGLYIWLRNYGGKLQFKIAATTFMGTIDSHDWTDLDIGLNDEISLIFKNEDDHYRILFNNYEVVGGKLDEIYTSDSCDRNGRTWFGIGCWHNNVDADLAELLASRAVIIKSIDNMYDEKDMPESIIEIGEIEVVPDVPVIPDNPNEPNKPSDDKKGCGASLYGNGLCALVVIAGALLLIKKIRTRKE